jgi:hypothetical protein
MHEINVDNNNRRDGGRKKIGSRRDGGRRK